LEGKMEHEPIYISKYKSGELEKIKNILYKKLEKCDLCPINCGADRYKNNGACGAGSKIKISEYVLYPGEEPPLTGSTGAGGIFFSNCSMKCVYCQNFRFSQLGYGKEISVKELSDIFMEIQDEKKAVNLDLVTATAYLPFIIDALILAVERGFYLPLVWNTSSYERKETMELLDGIIDIYLPDLRYSSNIISKKYSKVNDYLKNSQETIQEIFRQIGNEWITDADGTLKRGIILRILVLPNNIRQAKELLKYIKYNLSDEIHISLMDQYVPVHKAYEYEEISRYLKKEEYKEVVDCMLELDLKNGWIQEHKLLD